MENLFGKEAKNKKIEKFIIVSEDASGSGWAHGFIQQGNETIMALKPAEDDKNLDKLWMVGSGMFEVLALEDVFKNRNKYKDWGWLFDMNCAPEEADQLMKEGFYVLGSGEFRNKLEHDRKFAADLTEKAGVDVPETYEFNTTEEGIALLESNPEKAYIFKPDEPNDEAWVTTVPDSERDDQANEELLLFLQSQNDEGSYVLQERKSGIEVNVEIWLFKGNPYFAYGNFECKKQSNGDYGALVGCAHDIHFTIPLDSRILHETLYKLIKLPEFKDYTGFIDMNVIAGDRKYWFIEYCARFGYNSHPNQFINLALDPWAEIFSDMLLGNNLENFYQHFREGFGASIVVRKETPVPGLPVMLDESIMNHFYPFDLYMEDGIYKTAGYGQEVGIICGYDYDLKSAADEVLRNLNKIHFPGRSARTDINKTDYLMNPYERWEAAETMRLFEPIQANK